MLKTLIIAMCIMLATVSVGFGKSSGIEGKVVDTNGKPMVGVKVVAKQQQPLKGYEKFESTTRSNGVFKLNKLFPNSEYELTYIPGRNTGNLSFTIMSGPAGQTKILENQIFPDPKRFKFTKAGDTVHDTKTRLMWTKNANIAGRQMDWNQAQEWVKGLDIDGHNDWRMPTIEELAQLATAGVRESGFSYLGAIGFNNVQTRYWASTEANADVAWYIDMDVFYDRREAVRKDLDLFIWPVRTVQ